MNTLLHIICVYMYTVERKKERERERESGGPEVAFQNFYFLVCGHLVG